MTELIQRHSATHFIGWDNTCSAGDFVRYSISACTIANAVPDLVNVTIEGPMRPLYRDYVLYLRTCPTYL